MKVQVWDEQVSLFEMTVLAATAELVPASLETMIAEGLEHPLLLVGRAFAPSREQPLRSLANTVYRGMYPMIVVPPFGDTILHRYLDLPLDTVLVRRSPTATTAVVDQDWAGLIGHSPTVRSDYFIDTALGGGQLAVDDGGHLVALHYQPRNTSGAVFITTLLLLAHTALSDEDDRQRILAALLGWRNSFLLASTAPPETEVEEPVPSRDEIVPVLLALAVAGQAEPAAVISVADAFLGMAPGPDAVKRTLKYFEQQGVLHRSCEAEGVSRAVVDQPRLQQIIEDLGLHAYAREIRELAAERGGDVV